jgi:predicted O-methyltransferase YrrM
VGNQGAYPAGHFYSPIPSRDDLLRPTAREAKTIKLLPGIDLNEDRQLKLLNKYVQEYAEYQFKEEKNSESRYYYDNSWFCYSDAFFLYSFLREFKPKKIVEVGSGFSSAVILDTVERFFPKTPILTFVEPYPDRLYELLKKGDTEQIEVIESVVQDVSFELFTSLESGDLLFVDSSHVVKFGSDLKFLFFEVLPRLDAGVFVHFHDIFYPFEYPSDWLEQGRFWNECYFLRAFLAYNSAWSIEFFSTYVHLKYGDVLEEEVPLCVNDPGGSIYLRRRIEP